MDNISGSSDNWLQEKEKPPTVGESEPESKPKNPTTKQDISEEFEALRKVRDTLAFKRVIAPDKNLNDAVVSLNATLRALKIFRTFENNPET